MTSDPTTEARKVLGGYWCNGNKRPCDDICAHCAEHANGAIAALDRAGKVIVDKAPVGDCEELVIQLQHCDGSKPALSRVFMLEAADAITRLVRERDEARRALDVRTWTEEERDGMSIAFHEAEQRHGHYETLFAVGAWLLRHRARAALNPGAAP